MDSGLALVDGLALAYDSERKRDEDLDSSTE